MSEARNSAPAGAVSTAKPSNWNVPNVLTVLRIIAVPFCCPGYGRYFWRR